MSLGIHVDAQSDKFKPDSHW